MNCPICGESNGGGAFFSLEFRHGLTGEPMTWTDACSSVCVHRAVAILRARAEEEEAKEPAP